MCSTTGVSLATKNKGKTTKPGNNNEVEGNWMSWLKSKYVIQHKNLDPWCGRVGGGSWGCGLLVG